MRKKLFIYLCAIQLVTYKRKLVHWILFLFHWTNNTYWKIRVVNFSFIFYFFNQLIIFLIKKTLINCYFTWFHRVQSRYNDLFKFLGISGLPFSIRVQVCRGRDNIVLQIGSNALNRSDRTCEEIDSVIYPCGRSTKLQYCTRSKKCMIEI